MKTTIDGAGRVVVPKALRDELGLEGGESLDISLRADELVIQPVALPMRFDEDEGCIVVEGEAGMPMPALSVEEVRAVLDRVRR